MPSKPTKSQLAADLADRDAALADRDSLIVDLQNELSLRCEQLSNNESLLAEQGELLLQSLTNETETNIQATTLITFAEARTDQLDRILNLLDSQGTALMFLFNALATLSRYHGDNLDFVREYATSVTLELEDLADAITDTDIEAIRERLDADVEDLLVDLEEQEPDGEVTITPDGYAEFGGISEEAVDAIFSEILENAARPYAQDDDNAE